MSALTKTRSQTYTSVDIANVVRRVEADLIMIAQSTGAITEDKARNYAHDIEKLAQGGYLSSVDLTLLEGGSAGREVAAVCYDVDDDAGSMQSSRPGGVMWPRPANAYLRIVLSYTPSYTDQAQSKLASTLKISWSPTNADTRHLALGARTGRDYASGGYGLRRSDFQ